jgi:peptide/nickel transport system permease protein
VSLSVGILGTATAFTVGLLLGGLSGYLGGIVDTILMRFSEIVIAFPAIYLLFALRATFPPSLNSVQVYLLIVLILSFVGWASVARTIRGLVLSLRGEEYVLSARAVGLGDLKIIVRHVLPNTLSYVIIQATLQIPGYILGESALSLLGLGITQPQSSWGLMLAVARNYRVVRDFPWVLIPGFFIFVSIMAWNFVGDGIRDAVDPRSRH